MEKMKLERLVNTRLPITITIAFSCL